MEAIGQLEVERPWHFKRGRKVQLDEKGLSGGAEVARAPGEEEVEEKEGGEEKKGEEAKEEVRVGKDETHAQAYLQLGQGGLCL